MHSEMNRKFIILLIVFFCTISAKSEKLRLSPFFSDNMIVQREHPVRIFGYGSANENVVVSLEGQEYKTTVDRDSTWQIVLPAFDLGKKYTLSVASGTDFIRLENIRSGDVWLCSGQSNMEFQMVNFPWCDAEIQKATDHEISFYSVPNQIDLIPATDLPEGASWKIAMGEDLKQCSATAYFFAQNLRREVDVPIGLICSDWSGTAIEPWMSLDAIAQFPQFGKEFLELARNNKSKREVETQFADLRKTWDHEHYLTGKGIEEKWYRPDTDFLDWKPYKPSDGYWQKANIGLDNFQGTVWFQTTFDLPDDYKEGDFHLFLNYVKDYNTTWVNGVKVGEVFGDKNWSDYYVAEDILKPKDNILVVRVMNVEGDGGFNFHPLWGTPILNGQWYFKADGALQSDFYKPHIVNVNPFSHPSIIYNAMINPLAENVKIKGVIWYQGESNAGRGFEYRSLFSAMINDWRNKFDMPQLPFYFVQLANFDQVDASGNNNDWAELRESQKMTTALPHVKMASAIDLGEAEDIHPKNKQEVGARLAQLALADCYNLSKEERYPEISEVYFDKNRAYAKITADFILKKGSSSITGFALAGEDQKFHPAKAKLKNGMVEIYSDAVPHPVAVRYAWAKNPGDLVLFGKNGLPLLPYRSDKWKGLTDDRVYHPDIVYW